MTNEEFLFEYLNTAAPTGFEQSGQKVWLDFMKAYSDEYITDTYGSAVAVINPSAPYKVVIEAHADEISWYVNYISDSGYLYLTRNGGSDPVIAPSKWVNLHGDNGTVKGIFGWPAIHVRKRVNEKAPDMDTVFIDVGASSKEEVEEMGIHVGTVATFEDELRQLTDKLLTGRALDNRIGGYIIAMVAKTLKERNIELPFGLYVVNAVQEEIGLRGAEMIAASLNPDVAVVIDVTHDTHSPMYDKKKSGDQKCGKGPVLTYGPAVQNNLLNRLIQTAETNEIPFQRAAASRSTGTDADAFAYTNGGIATALISLPLKYMHTTVETVHWDDINNIIELYVQFLSNLPSGYDFRYIK